MPRTHGVRERRFPEPPRDQPMPQFWIEDAEKYPQLDLKGPKIIMTRAVPFGSRAFALVLDGVEKEAERWVENANKAAESKEEKPPVFVWRKFKGYIELSEDGGKTWGKMISDGPEPEPEPELSWWRRLWRAYCRLWGVK